MSLIVSNCSERAATLEEIDGQISEMLAAARPAVCPEAIASATRVKERCDALIEGIRDRLAQPRVFSSETAAFTRAWQRLDALTQETFPESFKLSAE